MLWAYNWVVSKRALADGGPLEFVAARGVFATIALFAMLAVLRKPLRCPDIPGAFVVALFLTVGTGGLTAAALVTGGAGRTAVLVYLMPFWTLILAWPLLGETVRGWQWLAVGCAVAGLVMVIAPWQPQSTLLASVLALASGVCWSIAAIVIKRLRVDASVGLMALTAWQMLFGTIVLLVLAALFPTRPIVWTPYMMWAIFYNAVPVGAVGWLLWLYALDRLPAGTASMGILAVPVLGVIAAALELGERPAPNEAAGIVLIVLGLGLLAWISVRARARVAAMRGPE